jgi:hypothetical protein
VKKVKENINMFVQPHPNFRGRNGSVHVMSKWWVKESRLSYGELVPNDTVTGTIGRNEMDTHADTCCAGANWRLLDFTNEVSEVTPAILGFISASKRGNGGKVWYSMDISQYRS